MFSWQIWLVIGWGKVNITAPSFSLEISSLIIVARSLTSALATFWMCMTLRSFLLMFCCYEGLSSNHSAPKRSDIDLLVLSNNFFKPVRLPNVELQVFDHLANLVRLCNARLCRRTLFWTFEIIISTNLRTKVTFAKVRRHETKVTTFVRSYLRAISNERFRTNEGSKIF